jgi:hypothetical protein
MLLDVSAEMWALVDALNAVEDVDDFRASRVHGWWSDAAANPGVRFLVSDDAFPEEGYVFDDVSSMFHAIKTVLRDNDDDRYDDFHKAYDRICAWCDMQDCLSDLQGFSPFDVTPNVRSLTTAFARLPSV